MPITHSTEPPRPLFELIDDLLASINSLLDLLLSVRDKVYTLDSLALDMKELVGGTDSRSSV